MTETPSAIKTWLESSLAGSLVSQISKHRGIELESLPESRATVEIQAICTELGSLGIDPELTAEHLTMALACLFVQTNNAEAIIDAFTGVLWNILGDPSGNGEQPPELYRKAGFSMHLALVGFFDPSITERVLES